MALFGKKKKSEEAVAKVIRSVVVRTENVAKELMSVAAGNDVDVATLDFNILDVQTKTRVGAEGKDSEWEELSSDEVAQISDGNMMLNPVFEIKQLYEIEIFTITEPDPFSSFNIAVGANAALTKVYLTIRPGSKVTYFEGMEASLVKLINKKKLRANLMISLFDEPMKAVVEGLVARTRVSKTMTFDEKEMLLIAQGIEPVMTINDALILHYDKKQSSGKDTQDRVDYSKRGYLVSTVENELLIEYVKPKLGEAGRNCRGEYLVPAEPIVEHAPDFSISDKIEKIEADDKVEYRAKQSGYVTFEGNSYDINTEMEVSEISFKTTGSIESGLDADVAINVKEADVFKDAIGMGMDVEVNEINIDGNVGSSSKLRANKATIEGQVHQSAEVVADELKINIHKGMARGKNVHITRLEHGTVEGEVVTVAQAIGGKIFAKEVHIEILGSHVTITATEKIEVQQLKGSENNFIIDPVMMGNQEELAENEEKVKEAKRHIIELEKEVEKYTELIESNEAAFIDLKKRLIHYKKNGVQMPSSFVKKYKQFQQMQTHMTKLNEELTQKNEYFKMLTVKHHAFQSNIFDARVVCHDRWRGHNTIVFKLIEPELEVMIVPMENTHEEVFALYEDEESGEFSIVSVQE